MSQPRARRALITGITGQDGAYLAQFLLERDYEVHGLSRRPAEQAARSWRISALGLGQSVIFHAGDVTESDGVRAAMQAARPEEIYHLAGQSSVAESWRDPKATLTINFGGLVNLLEVMRAEAPQARLFQASSAEIFGANGLERQNESSPFAPRNPYGHSKLQAHLSVAAARRDFGLHLSCGILFNHESPLRETTFISRKISDGVARIKLGLLDTLRLGNMDAQRDWGDARDYVRAMWLMLRQEKPDDFILARGRAASVRDLCRIAFAHAGLDRERHVRVDPDLLRPADIPIFLGDPAKAAERLGWRADIPLEATMAEMVDADIARLRQGGGGP
jgi:GDPmannose 4,6-dehydratase